MGGSEGGQAVALVVDAEVTSILMMGALSPGLKRHSVTLFEGAPCMLACHFTPGREFVMMWEPVQAKR